MSLVLEVYVGIDSWLVTRCHPDNSPEEDWRKQLCTRTICLPDHIILPGKLVSSTFAKEFEKIIHFTQFN